MEITASNISNSVGIIIPKSVCQLHDIEKGTIFEVTIKGGLVNLQQKKGKDNVNMDAC